MLLLLVMMTGNCQRACKSVQKERVSPGQRIDTGYLHIYIYLICVPVGCDQELCGCFSDRIRIGGPQRAALIKDLRSKSSPSACDCRSTSLSNKSLPADLIRAGPVHLVCANVDEAPRLMPGPVGSFQQHSGSIHIDALEAGRGPEGRLWWQKNESQPAGPAAAKPSSGFKPPLTDVSLGSEVKDGVDAFCVENVI